MKSRHAACSGATSRLGFPDPPGHQLRQQDLKGWKFIIFYHLGQTKAPTLAGMRLKADRIVLALTRRIPGLKSETWGTLRLFPRLHRIVWVRLSFRPSRFLVLHPSAADT